VAATLPPIKRAIAIANPSTTFATPDMFIRLTSVYKVIGNQ
jgi:hypothetical protein